MDISKYKSSYSVVDLFQTLVNTINILFNEYDYDGDGYENLIIAREIAKNRLSLFEEKSLRLEKDLIHPNEWASFYHLMPQQCKDIVDGPPDVVGIGVNKDYGWFILFSGQGPYLAWAEKKF